MVAITTLNSAGAWSPVVNSVAPQDAIPDSLVLRTSTVAGAVEGDAVAVHCQYVDDATAGFVAEGAAIDEAAPSLSEAVVFTGKIAQLLRLSREQFNQPNASELLATSVARAVTKAGDLAYLQQAKPTSPAVTPPAGLLNTTGIVNGGAVAGDLDVLVDTLATVASNGGSPSHILLSPTAWASLRKFKIGTDFNSTLLGTGATDAVPYLLDVPVVVSSAVPANAGVIVDQTAIVSAVGNVMVATSDQVYFGSDSVAVRCTWRFGAAVVKPNRIAKFTVTPPAA
ncbi:phage major capsid protein [Tsukamurella sp. NPDC003166]|uniref:phage major capsid protein n=1 Tax=Tsukamurella sp. NPDC003166 TaxID=3154444 RepID=UPI0033B24C29